MCSKWVPNGIKESDRADRRRCGMKTAALRPLYSAISVPSITIKDLGEFCSGWSRIENKPLGSKKTGRADLKAMLAL